MKVRIVRDWRSRSRTIKVTLTGKEKINYSLAEWLRQARLPFLPPFTYQLKGESAVFLYDITGAIKLKTFLKARISTDQYGRLIRSIADVMDTCTSQDASAENVLWNKRYIYMNQPDSLPLFVLVPGKGLAQGRPSAHDLMMYLSESSRIHFPNEEDKAKVEIVRDYIWRNPTFSSVAMRDWMLTRGVIGKQEADLDLASLSEARTGDAVSSEDFSASGTASLERTQAGQASHKVDNGQNWAAWAALAWDPVQTMAGGGSQAGGSGSSFDDAASTPIVDSSSLTSSGVGVSGARGFATGAFAAPSPPEATSPSDTAPLPTFIIRRVSDGMSVRLSAYQASIGRSQRADASFSGTNTMSRVHAWVEYVGPDSFALVDNKAPNGTFIRGVRLPSGSRTILKSGSVFSLSSVEFQVILIPPIPPEGQNRGTEYRQDNINRDQEGVYGTGK